MTHRRYRWCKRVYSYGEYPCGTEMEWVDTQAPVIRLGAVRPLAGMTVVREPRVAASTGG